MQAPKWNCGFPPAPLTRQLGERSWLSRSLPEGEGMRASHEPATPHQFEFLRLTIIQLCAKGSPVWSAFSRI